MLDIEKIIKNIPKTELHCHIDGSVRPETLFELAKSNSLLVPFSSIDTSIEYFQVKENCNSLNEYLEKFNFPLRVMQSKENIYRIVMELIEDSKKDGIIYTELRFAPLQHENGNLTAEESIEATLQAMKDGKDKYGVVSKLILCSLRHNSVDDSIKVVNLAKKYISYGVVAVDLAGNESDFPPELHKKAFDLAYKSGINITIHAGETGIYQNILKSIDLLHASRIGHGIYAYMDSKTLEYLIENQVTLEMCPTSNLHTKAINNYIEHPIKTYLKQGINVTLNTDNRTVSNINLIDEYINLISKLNFSLDEVLKLIRNGITSSFVTNECKNLMLNKFNESVKSLNK
jgi:adenosine deaminase